MQDKKFRRILKAPDVYWSSDLDCFNAIYWGLKAWQYHYCTVEYAQTGCHASNVLLEDFMNDYSVFKYMMLQKQAKNLDLLDSTQFQQFSGEVIQKKEQLFITRNKKV